MTGCLKVETNSPLCVVPQVGLVACNDYILLECCIFRILKNHFSKHASYLQLIELFHEVRKHEWEARVSAQTSVPSFHH